MSTQTLLISIAIMIAVTAITRAFPFILFGGDRKPPKALIFLGKALPPAIIAMLVVYCLKGTELLVYPYGIPEAISVVVIIILHILKRNNLLSIFGGTILYMLLVQFVFK